MAISSHHITLFAVIPLLPGARIFGAPSPVNEFWMESIFWKFSFCRMFSLMWCATLLISVVASETHNQSKNLIFIWYCYFVIPERNAYTTGYTHIHVPYLVVSQNQDGLLEFCSEDSQVIVCTWKNKFIYRNGLKGVVFLGNYGAKSVRGITRQFNYLNWVDNENWPP